MERLGAELAREQARAAELVPPSDDAELEGLRRHAADAETRRAKLETELESARHDVSKYKGRWETLDKAYVILRGELELKKDEARAQRVELERLRTLEVILDGSRGGRGPEELTAALDPSASGSGSRARRGPT